MCNIAYIIYFERVQLLLETYHIIFLWSIAPPRRVPVNAMSDFEGSNCPHPTKKVSRKFQKSLKKWLKFVYFTPTPRQKSFPAFVLAVYRWQGRATRVGRVLVSVSFHTTVLYTAITLVPCARVNPSSVLRPSYMCLLRTSLNHAHRVGDDVDSNGTTRYC